MLKRILLVVLTILLLLTTGCWDKVEIHKRIFVTTMGIDKFEGEQQRGEEAELFTERQPDRYSITYGYPNTAIIAGKGEGEPTYKLSSTGVNMNDIQKNMSTRLSGVINFDHTKLIVIGEALAKDPLLMKEVLDTIERSPEIGRRIHLMITKGRAEEIMNVEVPQQPIIGLYVRDLMAKPTRMARAADADLGYILRTLHEGGATIAPKITISENEVKVAGAAVFKNYGLVGWLGEIETYQLMIMLDRIDMAVVNIQLDNQNISVTITDSKTYKKLYEKEGKIVVSFDIDMEGSIRQHEFTEVDQLLQVDHLEKLEKKIEEQFKERIKKTFVYIQEEYGADVIEGGEYLRKYEPDLWETIKDEWEDIFPEIQIEVNIRMKIRRIGVVK